MIFLNHFGLYLDLTLFRLPLLALLVATVLLYHQFYLRNRLLPLAKVHTFEMQYCRQEINEEKSNDCTIYTNDIIDIDLEVPNNEANSNDKDEVYYFWHAHESLLRLLNTQDIKKPLSN